MWQDSIYPQVHRALGTHGSPPDRESNVELWNIPRPIRQISKDTVSRRITRLELFDGKERTLLVIDDLMRETDERVTKIFTKISDHRNVSVLYLTHNLFYKANTPEQSV